MTVHGVTIKEMVMDTNFFQMDKRNSKVCMLMTKKKVKEFYLWENIVIRVFGKMIKEMDLVYFMILTVLLRKDNLEMTNKLILVFRRFMNDKLSYQII
jgi:hypothetical protein